MSTFNAWTEGLSDKDIRTLSPRELSAAVGVESRPSTDSLFPTGMRAAAGTFGSAEHTGICYAQYDTADSKLIVGSGTSIYEATAATSGMTGTAAQIDSSYLITNATAATPIVVTTSVAHAFVNAQTVTISGVVGNLAANGSWVITYINTTSFSLNSSVGTVAWASGGIAQGLTPMVLAATPTALIGRTQFDKFYLASGVGITTMLDSTSFTARQNLIRKSDGTWMLQSLIPPSEPPSLTKTPVLVASTVVPTDTADGDWVNITKVADDDNETRAHAQRKTAGTKTYTWSLPALTAVSHKLKVLHSMRTRGEGLVVQLGVGGDTHEATVATLKIEFSLNSGTTYTTLSNKSSPYPAQWSEFAIPDASYGAVGSVIKVKGTLTYTSGSVPVTAFINTIKAKNAADTFPDAPLGFRYLVTEWDDTNQKESAPSPETPPITLDGSTNNYVLVTLPTSRQNNRSTHWNIYRQPEGAAAGEFDKYGRVGQKAITATTFLDLFDATLFEVARPALRVLTVGQGDDVTFYPLDQPVPLASSWDLYKGSLIFKPVDDNDNVYFTPPYDLENRPSLYAIPTRTPRNDQVITVATCDNVWLIFFRNWCRRYEGLPLVINGLFDAANWGDLSTSRGICGPLAVDKLTNFQPDGSTWLAVADEEGFYVTNGFDVKTWAENLAWKTRVELGQQTKFIVSCNAKKRRAETYVVAASGSVITQRYDFYYGDLRQDGQPRIYGPHPVNARGVTTANISGVDQRFTANGTTGTGGGATAGAVYLEDGTGFVDASRSYLASTAVQRLVTTGKIPITGLGEDGYVRSTTLRTRRTPSSGSYAAIAETTKLEYSTGEALTSSQTFTPATPAPLGVMLSGETVQWSGDDSGTTEKAELLGLYLEFSSLGGEASALRASLNATAGTTTAPT